MIKKIIIDLIKLYQRMPLSSHNQCKFVPSCSNYAIDAIEIHGVFKGVIMAIKRIFRCNPFNKGGIDPVKRKD